MELSLDIGADGALVVRHNGRNLLCRLPNSAEVELLVGGPVDGYYALDAATFGVIEGHMTVTRGGVTVAIEDAWRVDGDTVHLQRSGRVTREGANADTNEAVRISLELDLAKSTTCRFVAPGMIYSPDQWEQGGTYSFSDHRLAYPMVARWSAVDQTVVWLARATTATYDVAPDRQPGQSRFSHDTDIGSVGFSTPGVRSSRAGDRLVASWPYWEGETSAMLDASGRPAAAFAPIPAEGREFTVEYRIGVATAASYSEAVSSAFQAALDLARPQPSPLPVSLEESIDLRLNSAAKTFRRDGGFAAFILNFDPERGYDSEAKAFGASFAEHTMGGSRDIIEYGFTGRQLNVAYLLAERDPDGWRDRGAAVVDSFVREMTTPSGWVHTLWHLGEARPLYACGDPSGPVMHYLGESPVAGTYTRMMAEAGCDLVANISLHRSLGRDVSPWQRAAVALGEFFLAVQERDGSWFRAYSPAGEPIVGTPWFGDRASSAKSATGTVAPFLATLAAEVPELRVRCHAAIERSARFVLDTFVAADDYRGGTLDNPNLVDKEAAFIAMRALTCAAGVALEDDASTEFLDGASRAAEVALTWHSIWAVPNVAGTPLADAGVSSVGWGGINSVWGVGVTDIYSLFFIADLHRLGIALGIDRFVRIAGLIAASSVQLLATPGALHGFADAGMQPEGIAFCPQGVDDGLIAKGDTWGGLGWPYTAGTLGIRQYLFVHHATTSPTPAPSVPITR